MTHASEIAEGETGIAGELALKNWEDGGSVRKPVISTKKVERE